MGSLVSALFLLISAFSAWCVWRRSPAYSWKITLRIFGVIVLVVTFFFSLAYLPVSENVRIALLIGSLVVSLFGAAPLILYLSNGHVAALPASVRVLSTHRLKVQHWIWRLLIFVAVCAGLALVLKGDLIWVPITLGGFVVLCSATAIVALYLRAIRLDRGLSLVLAEPWVHWQYTQDSWNAWAANRLDYDLSQNKGFLWKRDWRKYLKMFAGALVSCFFCSFFEFSVPIKSRILISFVMSVPLVILFAAVAIVARNGCNRRYRKMLATVPDTYIGDQGIYSGGEFTLWSLSGSYLVEATTEPEPPPHIKLVFQTNILDTKWVLIPPGSEADIESLQAKLRQKMPKAAVHVLAPTSSV